jgi:Phosphotransferase enzyme family
MSMQQAQRREELGERIAAISRWGFIQPYVCRVLPEAPGPSRAPDNFQALVVQNDGTGPATVEYRLADSTRLFAKLYADESGAHAYEVLHNLWCGGFDRRQCYQVPEPLCFVAEYQLLLMREARGETLASYLSQDGGKAVTGVREAARWLLQLHSSPLRVGKVDQPWYMFLKLSDRLAKAASSHPQELKNLTAMLVRLGELAERREQGEVVQAHGQFRPIHVFLSGETVTVIDVDRSVPADPAKDLAEFVHRLRSTILRGSGSMRRTNLLTRTFLDEYAAREPSRLSTLSFYQGFHILVSLCRHLKQLRADDPAWGPTMDFYVGEFETAMSGEFDG